MTSTSIAIRIPRGMFLAGSRASSAASGTPSIARNSQMANGTAAQMPKYPYGRNADAPLALSSTGILVRLCTSNRPTAPIVKMTRPTSATPVMTNIVRSASPAPLRWMPMKTA
ncbi:Uncharacterised protein [Mycobacteroides abscessus subsp. abscessus]|nr:Uncharacterised protein [Mycobacteroides abscessus subsp. abscessus]